MKRHILDIDVEGLLAWQARSTATYASAFGADQAKVLQCTCEGVWIVEDYGKEIYRGNNPEMALEAYNELAT